MSRLIPNTLIYDHDCELCVWAQEIIARWDRRRRIRYLAFQDPPFREWFPDLDRDDPGGFWPAGGPPRAMLFIDGGGQVRVGMDAFRTMLPQLAGGRLLAVLFYMPGVPWLAARFYEWLARNRYRLFGPTRRP
ncbi:MAG: DCC1-like thiol-disulfide oxidoreductase family protein [Nitrospirota bacterium]